MLQRGTLRPQRCLLAGAVAATLALLLFAPGSMAGVYHVFSCRIPYGAMAGDAAGVEIATESRETPGMWSHVSSGTGLYGNSCSSSGALSASLAADVAHVDTDLATWEFTAPTSERIHSATLWRSGDAAGGSGYLFWLATPSNPSGREAVTSESVFDGCAYVAGCTAGLGKADEPLAPANKVQVPEANLGGTHLYINASCSSSSCPSDTGDEQGHAVVVYVYAADIALEEQASPTVGDLSGELAGSEPLSGTASLFFQASDAGSGVFKEVASVDGEVLSSQIVDETTLCKEVPVPAEDGPAFLSAQPCPSTANGRISLDTADLSNGAHHLLVEVTNAAGNATTVLSKTIEVANSTGSGGGSEQSGGGAGAGESSAGLPNGTPVSEHPTLRAAWVRARSAQLKGSLQLTGAFGHSETITGRLTAPDGGAIAGATIEVTARKSYGGASTLAIGSASTNAQGDFSFHLAKQSSSELIELSYSPTLGGQPVVSQSLQLSVHVGVQLHVSSGSAQAGQTIRLQGRILGAPIPASGKQVVLEARSQDSRWLQFLVLRSGAGGRFSGTHRFRLPGPVRYWFRAVCPEEADFPYATGTSNQVSVWER